MTQAPTAHQPGATAGTLVLHDVRPVLHDTRRDVVITDGIITSITDTGTSPAPEGATVIDAGGRVVMPGIVEPHLHLDKALLDARMPNLKGTLEGAITVTGALKQAFTTEDVLERSRTVLDMAIGNGTTAMRVHPDVDPIVHKLGAEAMLQLRDEYRGRIDLQVVAFPQEGIVKAPGTLEMMDELMAAGADVVGGCTYNEPTLEQCRQHVAACFDLAEKYDAPLDMHCDFQVDGTDPRYAMVEHIADVTIERGMQGRVSLGHMTSLGALSGTDRVRVWDKLIQAGINIVVLPFTDMHLNARNDDGNVRRGVAPVKLMWDVGVSVGLSSNNVRNAFTPFGNADLMDVALFMAQVGHMGAPADFERLMTTITTGNARIIGLPGEREVAVGAPGDLVVLDATDVADGLLSRAVRSFVIKGGRLVAESTRSTTLH